MAPATRVGKTSEGRRCAGCGSFLERGRQRPGRACVPSLVHVPPSVLQALTFIIFICFTASISAYMAAALLEFFITLAFLFLYATQYYQRFDRLNWPCLVRVCLPPCCLPHPILGPFFSFNKIGRASCRERV